MAAGIKAEASAKAKAQDRLDEALIRAFAAAPNGSGQQDILIHALCRRVLKLEKALAKNPLDR